MIEKETLIREIYEEKELQSDCLYTRFKDLSVEYQFKEFNRINTNTLMLIFGIATVVYQASNIVYFYLYYSQFYLSTFICIIILSIISFALLIAIIKTNPSSNMNETMRYIRYFINIFRNCHYLAFLIFLEKNNEDKRISIVRNFYLQSICAKGELLFFLQPSRIISMLVESICFVIILYANFTNEGNFTIYLPEILACLPGFYITTASNHLLNFKRINFLSVQKVEAIQLYFEGLLNSMGMKLVSFSNSVAYFSNLPFKSMLIDYGIAEDNVLLGYKDYFHHKAIKYLESFVIQKLNNKSYPKSLVDAISFLSDSKDLVEECNKFIYYGLYTNTENTKYFKVFYRKLYIVSQRIIIDILIDDITEIKEAELSRIETNLKQKLFSKLAHEFKTPLLIIKGLVSDISNAISQPQRIEIELIEIKSSQITHLSEYIHFLINDIIYYTNNDSMSINKENVDLKSILFFCRDATQALLAVMPGNRSNILVIINYDDELLFHNIYTDGARIKQVLLNLISNSVKFTKSGMIKLSAVYLPEYNEVEISVEDTGAGMSYEDLEKLSNNLDNSVKLNINSTYNEMGTGIGISIVKSILSKLGHTFAIYSKRMSGTRVSFKIKEVNPNEYFNNNVSERGTIKEIININTKTLSNFMKLSPDLILEKHESFEYYKENKSNFKLLRTASLVKLKEFSIIVADDSSTLRRSVICMLKKLPQYSEFDFVECSDGIQVLNTVFDYQLTNREISIIITDENMEYMCGSTAIKILRDLESHKKIKSLYIVSLTAFADETTLSQILSMGSNMVIGKPLNKELAVSILSKYKARMK